MVLKCVNKRALKVNADKRFQVATRDKVLQISLVFNSRNKGKYHTKKNLVDLTLEFYYSGDRNFKLN